MYFLELDLFSTILLIVASVFITYFVERKNASGGMAFFALLIMFVLLYFINRQVLKQVGFYIIHNIFTFIILFISYTIIGSLWSIFKWTEFVIREKRIYSSYPGIALNIHKPKPAENKDLLFTWIFWWPFSVLWFVIHKPITKIFNLVYSLFKKTYENIADRIFNETK